MLKSRAASASKYVVFAFLFCLLSNAALEELIAPYSVGMYAALVYCGQNPFALAVGYVLSVIIVDFSMANILYAAVPPLFICVMSVLFSYYRRKLKMWEVNIFVFVSLLPLFIANVEELSLLLHTALFIARAQVFAYFAVRICNAFLVRGTIYALSAEEKIAFYLVIGVLFLGLYNLNIFGFLPYYLIVPIAVLTCGYVADKTTAMSFAAAASIGGAAVNADLALVGLVMTGCLLALIFKRFRIIMAAAFCVISVAGNYVFYALPEGALAALCPIAASCLIFALLPNKFFGYISAAFGARVKSGGARLVINRNRAMVASRLSRVASVFYDVYENLTSIPFGNDDADNAAVIAGALERQCCCYCPAYSECRRMVGNEMSAALAPIASNGMYKLRVDASDLSPFTMSNCGQKTLLLSTANKLFDNYKKYLDSVAVRAEDTVSVAEQLHCVSSLIYELAGEVKEEISFDGAYEKAIINRLALTNIICAEAIITGVKGDFKELSLTVRKSDENKPELIKTAGSVMRIPLSVSERIPSALPDYVNLTLVRSPVFSVSYGKASKSCEENAPNGDSIIITKIGVGSVLLAISDGMGTGKSANNMSGITIDMIESLYKAGFDSRLILPLVNQLLMSISKDRYSCVDLVVINLYTGEAHFIKQGAVDTVIKRRETVWDISGNALPLGVLSEARPSFATEVLESGDIVVLTSDGIQDALTPDGLKMVINGESSRSPGQLASYILNLAVARGGKDDSTVIVAKLFNCNNSA